METKHTPGPWRCWNHVPNKRIGRIEWVISAEDQSCVANLKIRNGDSWNASLIAAAPEMLEALRAIESCLSPADCDRAANLVRDAIKKAEGR